MGGRDRRGLCGLRQQAAHAGRGVAGVNYSEFPNGCRASTDCGANFAAPLSTCVDRCCPAGGLREGAAISTRRSTRMALRAGT